MQGNSMQRRAARRRTERRAFSLIELVVVVAIIGIIASMAIPRLSRGSSDAGSAALLGDLAVVDKAIQLYAVEHGGKFPGPDADDFAEQLTQFTDARGNRNVQRTSQYLYGPYLVAVPAAPAGVNTGSTDVLIDATNSPPNPQPGQPYGWVYNPNTGEFYLNAGTMVQVGTETIGGISALSIK